MAGRSNPPRTIETVGLVGAGTMGAGIAQVALEAGHRVRLYDVVDGAVDRARSRIREGLARTAARLDLDPDTIDDWVDGRLGRLEGSATIDAAAAADLVIEAAIEDLAAKRAIFETLATTSRPDAVLATNTSALSVTAIAAGLDHPERILGLHFFNPVPRMALVEVVATRWTSPAVVDRTAARIVEWGKTPVRCHDAPGFIVNRVNRPFTIEALRLLEDGDADVATIDAAMRAAGYPMGPFELMDLIGIDVNLAAATAVWEGLGRPDRLRPSSIQARLVADGRTGRKAGVGFYRHDAGPRSVDAPFVAPVLGPGVQRSVVDRIEAAVADEAQRAVDDGIATPGDIALALRLGAGHPRSPFPDRDAARAATDWRARIEP